MSDRKSHDVDEIEGLLATRRQVADWLERLDGAPSHVPEAVRAKVRSDYQARLAQVVAQLATHGDLISSTLDALRSEATEFRQQQEEELEVRAEAELRHAVGEYGDDEWQLVELESSGKITSFDHELERLAGEIQRLEEVQALIAPEAVSLRPVAELRTVALVEAAVAVPLPRPEAPRFVPRGGGGAGGGSPHPREPAPPRAIPHPSPAPIAAGPAGRDDELAFLRSVSLEGGSPRRHAPARNPMAELGWSRPRP